MPSACAFAGFFTRFFGGFGMNAQTYNAAGNYTFHSDPGHAWMQVTKQEIVDLGIAHNISTYSYEKCGMVYLEEDCDACKFMAARSKEGNPVKPTQITESHTGTQSIIRNYPKYSPIGANATETHLSGANYDLSRVTT